MTRQPEAELPSGIVTFVFTDIVGSTALWEHAPDAMLHALARHDTLIETCVVTHGGVVVRPRGEGDSRFVVFARATAALAAAADIQRRLYNEEWTLPTPLRVRMALHTGAADLHLGDYYGSDVNRCARLRAIAHPGQTLVSQATVLAAGSELPTAIHLRNLGEHRLKDLIRPEQVFQLDIPGLPDSFPPLHSLGWHRTNLPQQPTPLLGRERELNDTLRMLQRSDVRLLTLTGPGGVGKTRLALQLGAELLDAFNDGVLLVSLSAISEPNLVLDAIARTLELIEGADQPMLMTLQVALRNRQMMLILDNVEQVLDAAPSIAALLEAAPQLKILVTSRAPLQLRGEHEYTVPPLELPDPQRITSVAALERYGSVALFVARARQVLPSFELTMAIAAAVALICVRLDGLPLAIELAAARVRVLSPTALLARLTSRLRLLTGGSRDLPVRHQTLRATIAWSHDLLDADEQTLFARLSVFVGGFTLDDAEALLADDSALSILDGLESLLNKSLLRRDEYDGTFRFVMLETIREYGLEQLEQRGEAEGLRHRHTEYFLALAEQAEPELEGAHQATWLDRLEREHDNLRAALRRTLAWGDYATAARLGTALWRFWDRRGHLNEGRRWLDQTLKQRDEIPLNTLACVLNGAGVLAWTQGDLSVAQDLLDQALNLFGQLDDQRRMAITLNNLGLLADIQGDYAWAKELYEQSLEIYRHLQDQEGVAGALNNLGLLADIGGDIPRAQELYGQSLALCQQLGDQEGIARAMNNLGLLALDQGDVVQASDLLATCLDIWQHLGSRQNIANALTNLGRLASVQGDDTRAATLHREGLILLRDLGDRTGIAECLEGIAGVATTAERAARLFGAAEALREVLGVPLPTNEIAFYKQRVMRAQAQLTPVEWQAAWNAGRSLSADEAVAEALADATGTAEIAPLVRSVR